MKIGIESMIQVILLCIACMVLAQMIGVNLYILQARTSFHMFAAQIECSQNDEAVIEQCKEEALERGYRLESELIDEANGESCILLSLYYNVHFSGWGKPREDEEMEGVIQGYAR